MSRLPAMLLTIAMATTTGCVVMSRPDESATTHAHEQFPDLANPDCATLRGRVEGAMNTSLKVDPEEGEAWDPVVAALLRCDEGSFLFERLIVADQPRRPVLDDQLGNFGARLLAGAHTRAPDELFATYQRYLGGDGRGPLFGADFAGHAAARVGHWLAARGHADQCQPLVTAAADASPAAREGLLRYFQRTRCFAAAPLLADLLTAQLDVTRVGACEALGELGGASELGKVKTVASTDKTSRDIEQPRGSGQYVKAYYVAEACSTAAGRIQLRLR